MRAANKVAGAPTVDGIIELAPGLHAIGSAIENDGRISWLPPSAKGFQATRSYVLSERDTHIVIDPGLRVHEDIVISQLQQFVGKGGRISAFLTRSEPDCFGLLERINTDFTLERIITGGGHNPFDGFDDIARAGKSARGDLVPIAREGKVAPIPLGDVRKIEVLHAPLRLNSTFWLYETGTRALFTSDAFSHSIGSSLEDAMTVDTTSDFTVEDVRSHMLGKFWWMTTANTRSLMKGLRDIFESRPIEFICPTHGRPFVGREAVQKAHDQMQDALAVSLKHHGE